MGQIKGNPALDRSPERQAYTDYYGVGGAAYRDGGMKPVMIDDDTTLDEVIDINGMTSGYAKDTDLTGGTIDAKFNTLTANEYHVTILSSSILLSSGSNYFGNSLDDNHDFTGDVTISGSLLVSGSTEFNGVHTLSGSNTIVGNTVMTGTNTIIGNTFMSGSIEVSGSSNFHNSIFIVTGSTFFTGSQEVKGNSIISGSLNVLGNLNVQSGSGFYRWGNKLFNYGQWGSLETQSGSLNTAYAMKLDLQYNGVSGLYIASGNSGHMTRIYVENTGLYNIQFSAQLHTTTNESVDFSIWFSKDGNNLANSNTDFTIEKITGGGYMVAALNVLEPISSGSYIELYYSKTTNNGQILYKPAQSNPTRPATPSVIVTMTQIA